MKRIISIMTCILLVLLCCSSIFAADLRFDTVSQLLDYWHMDRLDPDGSPYPDYVCGIWSRDGNPDHLNIALVEGETGESGKEEILSMLKNTDDISFSSAKYPHKDLLAIQWELVDSGFDMQQYGICGFGVDEMNNVVSFDMDMTNPSAQTFIDDYSAKYGDMVAFKSGSYAVPASASASDGPGHFEQGRFNKFPWASVLSMPILIAVFCIYANIQKRKEK